MCGCSIGHDLSDGDGPTRKYDCGGKAATTYIGVQRRCDGRSESWQVTSSFSCVADLITRPAAVRAGAMVPILAKRRYRTTFSR